jgi:hypothetical protein
VSQGEEDSDDPICTALGLGGGGRTLSQRADLARLQALGGVVGGALLGRLPGAVLGYVAAIGYNAYGLRAGGVLEQGGSQQGNRAYGAVLPPKALEFRSRRHKGSQDLTSSTGRTPEVGMRRKMARSMVTGRMVMTLVLSKP